MMIVAVQPQNIFWEVPGSDIILVQILCIQACAIILFENCPKMLWQCTYNYLNQDISLISGRPEKTPPLKFQHITTTSSIGISRSTLLSNIDVLQLMIFLEPVHNGNAQCNYIYVDLRGRLWHIIGILVWK